VSRNVREKGESQSIPEIYMSSAGNMKAIELSQGPCSQRKLYLVYRNHSPSRLFALPNLRRVRGLPRPLPAVVSWLARVSDIDWIPSRVALYRRAHRTTAPDGKEIHSGALIPRVLTQ
jgi:hypothetical protein